MSLKMHYFTNSLNKGSCLIICIRKKGTFVKSRNLVNRGSLNRNPTVIITQIISLKYLDSFRNPKKP